MGCMSQMVMHCGRYTVHTLLKTGVLTDTHTDKNAKMKTVCPPVSLLKTPSSQDDWLESV